MSNDHKYVQKQSNDSCSDSTLTPTDNTRELLDFHTCMARLRAISGEEKNVRAVQYFGIPAATYHNWLRRKRVNLSTVVAGLLRRGYSLDSFFAPFRSLHAPTLQGRGEEVLEQPPQQPVARRLIADPQLLLETYLIAQQGMAALQQVSRVLELAETAESVPSQQSKLDEE